MSLLRRIVNRLTRPSVVTKAQHDHVKASPFCMACGSMSHVQAHHVLPFHKYPLAGADPMNFISLCEGHLQCHLKIGHGGDWRFFNPDVVGDAKEHRWANDVARRLLMLRIHTKRLPDA